METLIFYHPIHTFMEATFKFKTNINCAGCVAKVTPFLNKLNDRAQWSVDTAQTNKILTVNTSHVSEAEIVATVQKAGFAIERWRG